MTEFRAKPEIFGLTPEQGEALYEAYVIQEKILVDAIRAASKKLDCKIQERAASRFLRTNGLIRPRSYYTRRNPFNGYNRADAEKAKAVIKRRGDWVD